MIDWSQSSLVRPFCLLDGDGDAVIHFYALFLVNEDYVLFDEALSFPPGTTPGVPNNQICANFSTLNDVDVEPTETVNLAATSPNPALQFTQVGGQAVINIRDTGEKVNQIDYLKL